MRVKPNCIFLIVTGSANALSGLMSHYAQDSESGSDSDNEVTENTG